MMPTDPLSTSAAFSMKRSSDGKLKHGKYCAAVACHNSTGKTTRTQISFFRSLMSGGIPGAEWVKYRRGRGYIGHFAMFDWGRVGWA